MDDRQERERRLMHLDLDKATDSAGLDADICVIGAGAAGITTARRLLELGRTVILLESGGRDYEAPVADLNRGANIGEPYYDLEEARLRFFGGTTAIWGGRAAELDPIDFTVRDWVPYSGWPFDLQTLRPYYRRARSILELPEEPPKPREMLGAGAPLPVFDPRRLRLGLWSFDQKFNRFTFDASADLIGHPRCRVVTHATVTSIEAAPSGGGITHVEARSLGGRRLTVRARAFVLAAGGIENARLLLASRSVAPEGLGNGRDQVGRYFMEHPHARGGKVVTRDAWGLLKAFGRAHMAGGQKVAALVTPSAEAQAERGILNTSLTIAARQPEGARQFWGMRAYNSLKHDTAPTRGGRRLWMMTKTTANWLQRRVDPFRPWLLHKLGRVELALLIRAEQAPDPASRIVLSRETDPLGVPRAALDWRLGDLDIRSVEGLVALLDEELRRLGAGRVEPAAWLSEPSRRWRTDPLISAHPIGGYHHMGSTRMGTDPATSVTDPSGRLHGVDNLYVVGSSTFPTSGWANPTLTILALALRTAELIAQRTPARAPAAAVSR